MIGEDFTIRRTSRAGLTHETSGFSLMEIMMVLAIIMTLAAVAIPRYVDSLARYRLRIATRRIVQDFAMVRSEAQSTSTQRTLRFDVGHDRYQLISFVDLVDSQAPYTVDLSEEPYCVRLVSANFADRTSVSFDGYGLAENGGSVVIQVGSETKTIILDAESSIAMEQ